jgi:SAM-dependent methyltransferase
VGTTGKPCRHFTLPVFGRNSPDDPITAASGHPFPDLSRAIREMVRVIKPGGRVLIHAYGDPHKIEFLGFLVAAVQSVRPDFDGPPVDPPPLEFQLADPNRLRSELSAAGLKDVKVETLTETTEHETGEDLWEWLVWSNPRRDNTPRDAQPDERRERRGPADAGQIGPRARCRQPRRQADQPR